MPIGTTLNQWSNKYPWLTNFKFWLILAVFIRLYGIWNPPLEIQHNWRQTTVTMVARNFLEVDNNILYPRIDFAGGDKTGITGMEFPILNYSIYLTSKVFGYQHWYGRLINLIISSIGIWFFFKLTRKYFTQDLAWVAAFLLLFSEWFMFSRKIMPDTFSMSLVFIGMYYGLEYLVQKKSWKHLISYSLLICIGVLSKLPSGYILVIVAIPFFDSTISVSRKVIFYSLSVLSIVPSVYWYFIWVPYLVGHYGFWHFYMGTGLIDGANDIIAHFDQAIRKFYYNAMGFSGFTVYLIGLFYLVKRKQKILIILFSLCSFAFLVIMAKSGFAFYHHNYYIIPFVPIMCLVAAWGAIQLKKEWKVVALALFMIEGIIIQMRDLTVRSKYLWPVNLEFELNKVMNKEDYILMNTDQYPTFFYFTHHKGWMTTNDQIHNELYMDEVISKGCKYLVLVKHEIDDYSKINYPLVLEKDHYLVYRLK